MKTRHKILKDYLVRVILVLCLLFPVPAFAGAATDAVKGNVDRVLDVLRDPSLKGESAAGARKDKIRAISENMFDFSELSKRTLARNWMRFDPKQQKEFIALYRSLLEDAYSKKIISFTNEKIVFGREISLTERTAEVQSTVQRKNEDIPINYRMILKDGKWKVYDVVIEGISLINNYRSQFREILADKTPESLIETLRKKVGKA